MRFLNMVCLGLAAASLAACAERLPVTSAPVSVAVTGNPNLRGVIGFEPTEIRSFKAKKEVAGAACDVQGTGFTAQAVTPAIVNLPDQRELSKPVTVACKLGDQVKTEIVRPVNVTSQKRMNAAGTHGGLIGVAISGIVEGVRDHSKDDWSYPFVHVHFK